MSGTVASTRKTQTSPFAATHVAAGFAVSLLFTLNVHNSWQTDFPFFTVYRSFISKCTCTHKWRSAMHVHMQTSTFFLLIPLRCLQRVPGRLTPSGFNFCDPWSRLWSRHWTAEPDPRKYLRSAAWGGGSEGKKLAFNKQDNGCHTPLLTPPLPAISLLLSFSLYASPTLSYFFYKMTFIV